MKKSHKIVNMKKVGNNHQTALKGIQAVISELEKYGAKNSICLQKGNQRKIEFLSPNGNTYSATVRTKTTGTWQTSIKYAEVRAENVHERDYWVFVDIGEILPKFYPVPFWWISNDIHEAHEKYLERHGGHRKLNENSDHHAVQLNRVKKWENNWVQLGLNCGL